MVTNLKIALAQLNPLVGDVIGNVDKLISVRSNLDDSVDILVAPELYISGYPIDDLVLREDFLDLVDKGLEVQARFIGTAQRQKGLVRSYAIDSTGENLPVTQVLRQLQGGKLDGVAELVDPVTAVQLADEIFLSEPWSGQQEFINYLIEEKVFLTSEAGEKIFDRIDKVLRSKPEQMIELAEIYLQILIIGFEGQYRGRDSENKIEEYIRLLYIYINRKEPGLVNKKSEVNGEQKIDRVHYERILSNLKPVKFFRINRPVFISLVVIVLLLIISQITYVVMTKPLRDVLESQKTVVLKKSKHQQLASLISVKNTKRKLKEL